MDQIQEIAKAVLQFWEIRFAKAVGPPCADSAPESNSPDQPIARKQPQAGL